MPPQQRIVEFFGNVQGVGFRYTAVRLAERFDVTGYVKNLPDGKVECVVEGESDEIDEFLAALGRSLEGYIRDRQEQSAPPSGKYNSFSVKF